VNSRLTLKKRRRKRTEVDEKEKPYTRKLVLLEK
jgi:hypothetical protein